MEAEKKSQTDVSWQSKVSINVMRRRADLMQQLRSFFYNRKIMEVSTPVIGVDTVTDVNIESLQVLTNRSSNKVGYLQTSPEYMMKRILAAGSGPIYQICPAFRQEECGRYHNFEFTMLEWYRPGFDEFDLLGEVDELLQTLAYTSPGLRISYYDLWQSYLQINPHDVTFRQLQEVAVKHGINNLELLSDGAVDVSLQLMMSHVIEPAMRSDVSEQQPVFVYDFPSSQAALAQIKKGDHGVADKVAARFEVYWRGIELANGFNELIDAGEQRQRFIEQQQLRKQREQNVPKIDEHFLAALKHGLPQCSGVALGLDRLFMLLFNGDSLADVTNFI